MTVVFVCLGGLDGESLVEANPTDGSAAPHPAQELPFQAPSGGVRGRPAECRRDADDPARRRPYERTISLLREIPLGFFTASASMTPRSVNRAGTLAPRTSADSCAKSLTDVARGCAIC